MTKYIFVTDGFLSSLGKGITAVQRRDLYAGSLALQSLTYTNGASRY